MQTSAHKPLPANWPSAEYTGTLLHRAEARSSVADSEGHIVPVLCLDIELDNAHRTHLHVEKPFPVGHHTQAEAEAHRLKKGMHVTVEAPLVGMRLVARNAVHIHVIPDVSTDLFQEQAA